MSVAPFFRLAGRDPFMSTFPDRIIHTAVFVTPVVKHWLKLSPSRSHLIKSLILTEMLSAQMISLYGNNKIFKTTTIKNKQTMTY